MKLLRDQNAVEEIKDLIDSCASKEKTWSEMHPDNNLHQQKRTGREMRLNTHIGEYEMDQIILDLGYDVNVLMK